MTKYEKFVRRLAKEPCVYNPRRYTSKDGMESICLTELLSSRTRCETCEAKLVVGLRQPLLGVYREKKRMAAKLRRDMERNIEAYQ